VTIKKVFQIAALFIIVILLYACGSNARNENVQNEPYVGSVTVVSNQTTYEPFSNWNHGQTPELSVSGIPVSPEHVLGLEPPWSEYNVRGQVLPHVIYANDFHVNISPVSASPSLSIRGSFVLYKNEYTIETIDRFDYEYEEYIFEIAVSDTDIANLKDLYSYLHTAEMGEYLLSISIWWGNDAGYASSMQYFFKIIVE